MRESNAVAWYVVTGYGVDIGGVFGSDAAKDYHHYLMNEDV